MSEQWNDSQSGWQGRLRARLRSKGLIEAQNELAAGYYRIPGKTMYDVAATCIKQMEEEQAASERAASERRLTTPQWWAVGIGGLAAGLVILQILFKVAP